MPINPACNWSEPDSDPKEPTHTSVHITKRLQNGRRKSFADNVKPIANSIAALARRVLKGREVMEGFSLHAAEQACRDLQKLNHIVQSLRRKLGAAVDIPPAEQYIEANQAPTLIKLAIMSLCQNSSGLAVEAGGRPDCDAEACAMATECEELVKSLGARFEGDARITPATALRTLAAAKRRFGVAVLGRIGLGGCSVTAEDELKPRLRRVFAELDTNASGTIDLGELRVAMASFDVPATDAELRRFLAAADTDGNGTVSFAEFHSLIVSILRENGIAVVPSRTTSASPEQDTSPGTPDSAARRSPDPAAWRAQRRRSSALGSIKELALVLPTPASAAAADADCPAPAEPALYMFPHRRQSVLRAKDEPAGRRRSLIAYIVDGVRARRRSSVEAEASGAAVPAPTAYSHLRTGAMGLRGWRSAPNLHAH